MSSSRIRYTVAPGGGDDLILPLQLNNNNNGNGIFLDIDDDDDDRAAAAKRSCFERFALSFCFAGLFFIIAGIGSILVMEPLVESQILDNLAIVEGSEVFKVWKDPPVTPVMFIRIFNFTNHQAFLEGSEKPHFEEVGPYVYLTSMRKDEIRFTSDHSISFKVKREYYFSSDLTGSGLSESDDIVIVPNIPLFGAFRKMSSKPDFAKGIFESLLKSYDFATDVQPFLRLTVREFLWGYPSILMTLQRIEESKNCTQMDWNDDDWGFEEEDSSECDPKEGNLAPFGIFAGRNGTALDSREIDTGSQDIRDKGLMISWHGKKRVNFWTEESCNEIQGRDPGNLPLNVKKTDTLSVFIGNLCRVLRFTYRKEVEHEGFRTMRFTPLENSFDSPLKNPENSCYCLSKPCLPSGLLDISGCQNGSPIFMSWPHFLHGDSRLVTDVTGLNPDPEIHSFVMDVEPKYGFTMSALARLQMNVIIQRDPDFSWTSKLAKAKTVLPFLWLEEGLMGPSKEMASQIRFMLLLPEYVRFLTAVTVIILGLLLLAPELIVLMRHCRRRSSRRGTPAT